MKVSITYIPIKAAKKFEKNNHHNTEHKNKGDCQPYKKTNIYQLNHKMTHKVSYYNSRKRQS